MSKALDFSSLDGIVYMKGPKRNRWNKILNVLYNWSYNRAYIDVFYTTSFTEAIRGLAQLTHISMNLGTFACIVLFGLRTGTDNIREKNKYFLVVTLLHRRNRKRQYRNFLNLKRISRPGDNLAN
ncbi:Polyphosphate kinase [Handroanthus impetiginosus]|uniref:NAD(P)H-quinone oxidoreductase subunit 5, chloroplastic n=1 Tax=Handroanthus impetiginosus TaxID=429701 RepID=A0A2G9HYB2_9LAMI|nr:Polyphosphate kinase [Handroanthus impetiginosus]